MTPQLQRELLAAMLREFGLQLVEVRGVPGLYRMVHTGRDSEQLLPDVRVTLR